MISKKPAVKTTAKAAKKTAAEPNLLARALYHTEQLLAIPAATNRIADSADYVEALARGLGHSVERDPDDTLRIIVTGKDKKRVVGLGAHLDRIGLMVDDLCEDGTVKISSIGGLYPGHVMDGCIASIATAKGLVTGVITHTDTPIHKMGLEGFEKRPQKWKHIRLRPDACIGATKKTGKEALQKLGVQNGQLVWLNPMLNIDNTHKTIRSRWLDNTLGCAALLALMEHWHHSQATPQFTIDLLWSAAEEAGMGGTSVLRDGLTDFIAVDTSVGEDTDDINNCVIKQKAGRFPYHIQLIEELEAAASKAKAGFERRSFEGGGTDAEQARSAGFKGRVGCIVVPIYGLHSIESATFNGLENLLKTLHTFAMGKA